MRRIRLTIHHLYADMMNLYGDRGNVISIKKRCEWRGFPWRSSTSGSERG